MTEYLNNPVDIHNALDRYKNELLSSIPLTDKSIQQKIVDLIEVMGLIQDLIVAKDKDLFQGIS